jgi:large subunit ribosomal protein L9
MKIFLEKNVSNLGVKGEVIEVAPGYFFNYLFPQGLASKATKAKVEQAKKKQAEIKKRKKKQHQQAKKLVEKLAKKEFKLEKTATEDGQLYAKVSPEEIVEVVGVDELELGMVVFEEEIKHTGEYMVELNLTSKVSAKIKLIVAAAEERK